MNAKYSQDYSEPETRDGRKLCRRCEGAGFVASVDSTWPVMCPECVGEELKEVANPNLGASPARAHDDEAAAAADEWEATVIFLAWAAVLVLVVVCVEQWPAIRSFVARWQP